MIMLTHTVQIEKYKGTHFRRELQTSPKRDVNRLSSAQHSVSQYENMYQDFQDISANLCHIAQKNNAKTIGFVSPLPMSGTSTSMAFVSYLVSASNSQPVSFPSDNWEHVLLTENDILVIDAQISNPSLHYKFNVPLKPGLVDFLPQMEKDLNPSYNGAIINEIPNTNIRFIPGGSQKQRHLTLDQIRILKDYIASIKNHFSYVLVDLPPVLTASESSTLAGICDAVILVVESGKTKKRDIDQAIKKLNKQNVNLMGSILNRQKSHVPQWLQKLI